MSLRVVRGADWRSAIRHCWDFVPADYALRLIRPTASHMHRGADAADIAEYAQITIDLRLNAGGFLRIVRQLHRGPSIDRRHLADDGDWIEIGRPVRGAADEVVGEVGAPTETDADAALEVVKGLLDGVDVHAIGEHQELLPGLAALLLPPFDDLFARRNRRRGVRTKTGPVGDPFRR